MSDDLKTIDLTKTTTESQNSDYIAWSKQKIKKALDDSKKDDTRYSQAEMMDLFNVER